MTQAHLPPTSSQEKLTPKKGVGEAVGSRWEANEYSPQLCCVLAVGAVAIVGEDVAAVAMAVAVMPAVLMLLAGGAATVAPDGVAGLLCGCGWLEELDWIRVAAAGPPAGLLDAAGEAGGGGVLEDILRPNSDVDSLPISFLGLYCLEILDRS